MFKKKIAALVSSMLLCLSTTGVSLAQEIRISSLGGPTGQHLQSDAKAFMEQNPGTKVIIEIAGGAESEYKANFPQIAASSDAPDMAWYWVDGRQYQVIAEAGLLEPLNDLYKQEGWFDVLAESTIKKYTQPSGQIFAVNTQYVWYPVIFYNKTIFKELGIKTPENSYKAYSSLKEWYEVVNKLRAGGYEPLTFGGLEGWILGHTHDILWQRMVSEETRQDLLNNWREGYAAKASYTGDEWLALDKMMLEWKNKGVFAEGFMGRNHAQGRSIFVRGKAAMYQDGVWAVGTLESEAPDMDIDWMNFPKILPEIDPQFLLYAGNGLMILKSSQNKELAKKFLAFTMSRDRQIALVKSDISMIPSRLDIPAEVMQAGMSPMSYDMWIKIAEIGSAVGWDDPVPADMANKSFVLISNMLSGSIPPEEVGKQLEKMAKLKRSGY